MSKFTETQLALLSGAAQRDDSVVVMPDHLKGSAAAKVAKVLLGKGLIEEVLAKRGMPTWRRDEKEGQSYALVITGGGRAAINREAEAEEDGSDKIPDRPTAAPARKRPSKSPRARGGRSAGKTPRKKSAEAPRDGTKQALLIKMLQRSKGATLDDLTKATDWLPHTTRAALTGLRKRGYRIERERDGDKKAVYRIVASNRRAA